MNTATVTWLTFENNGTFLQAYALQQTIKSLGYNNVILDDNRIQNKYKKKPNIKFYLYKIIVWFKNLLHLMPPSVTMMTHHYYKSFRNQYLEIYEGDDYANKYDAYICGSDQIWSPYLPFMGYYYLDFTSKKKIAYAPSVGTYACSEDYKKNVSFCLQSFSYISTREQAGKDVLSQLTNKPIKVVVDPTLLLKRENWDYLVDKGIGDDYIFCYFLTPNPWYVNHAFEMALNNHLKLKFFYTSTFFYKFKDDVVYGGPKEFLSYIKCAKMILTDSFHATVFSLLFQQDFITYKRFKDRGEKDQNARIYNLLTPLHLLDRFVDEDELNKVDDREPIDYDHVQNIMENIRVDSLNYLKTALSNE